MRTSDKESVITLRKRELRGSRLRCLMLTSMPRQQVAGILTEMVSPFAEVQADEGCWMPGGFLEPDEAKLGECGRFLSPDRREELTQWWLKVRANANTPNWDIVSSCNIDGEPGLILVEAKAHVAEAKSEGKPEGKSEKSADNHQQINDAIQKSNSGLNSILPGWNLSHDSHYQLCNRFAWTWKLATLGVPTILVYLGFLGATEMSDQGQPLTSAQHWQNIVLEHAKALVPEDAWERRLQTSGAPLWALIRSMDLQWATFSSATRTTA
jgi:hypothetical protein